ncbi:hypothetical protein [Streptomyces luteocolor]|uniref:hypothetical protein n=1 Tax=Streptomyces luteocolor TaxID=285500 RepID=UPI000853AB70|nr:hypothetical protein [Streptomyces luteocolor]
MRTPKIDRSLQDVLKRRKLFLRPIGGGGTVLVCVEDGSPEGFEIGRVILGRPSGAVIRYRMRRPDKTYEVLESECLHWLTFQDHVGDILSLASYDDVLRRAEVSSGVAATYTADLGEERAAWLAEMPAPEGITNLGNGRGRLTESAVAFLRCPSTHYTLTLTVHPTLDLLMIGGLDCYDLTREN